MTRRVKVSADGRGVVSHAGMGLVRELADLTGLSAQVTEVLADTYKGPWTYAPGRCSPIWPRRWPMGQTASTGSASCVGDRAHVFGAKASTTTMWRLVDERIDAAHLPGVRDARAAARAAAWAAGAAPPAGQPLHIDMDATLVLDHSDNKQDAAPTWKKTFGHHPLLAFWTAPRSPAVRRWPGCCARATPGRTPPPTTSPSSTRHWPPYPPGGAPTPTPTGHRRWWCAAIPPGPPMFAQACRDRGSGSPSASRRCPGLGRGGHPQPRRGWYPAIDSGGDLRDGARVAEATTLVTLSTWPAGTRLILRKERPHPGAQLRFTDIDGMRVTAFITDTTPGGARPAGRPGTTPPPTCPRRGPHPARQSRRPAQPAPCHDFQANAAWLEIVLAAADLVAWAQLIGFTHAPS